MRRKVDAVAPSNRREPVVEHELRKPLSIAQWIVQAHGGTLTVQSRLGRGSIFTVILPVVPQAPTAQPWADTWTSGGQTLPQWSHTDGQPLCPVVGPHGYEPAQPVTPTAEASDDDTDGM